MMAKITHSELQKRASKALFVISAVQNKASRTYLSYYALLNRAMMAKITHSALQERVSKALFVLSAVQNEA